MINRKTIIKYSTNDFLFFLGKHIIISFLLLLLVKALSYQLDLPFLLWYKDSPSVLFFVGSLLLVLGLIWDTSLFFTHILSILFRKDYHSRQHSKLYVIYQKIGFFSVGLIPIVIILFTIYIILETSNITIISLNLSGTTFQWKDSFFYEFEKIIFLFIADVAPNPFFWDILYNSAWLIEIFAIFLLIITSRNPLTVIKFCSSFVLLFYFGRLLGLLNPVKGPAFYKPDLFPFLDGTFSLKAMNEISPLMTNSTFSLNSGVLIGGISAMPSLHLGMVFITSYWLTQTFSIFKVITPIWVLLVWISTVLLGWHYISDGLGGLVLGVICIFLTDYFFKSDTGGLNP